MGEGLQLQFIDEDGGRRCAYGILLKWAQLPIPAFRTTPSPTVENIVFKVPFSICTLCVILLGFSQPASQHFEFLDENLTMAGREKETQEMRSLNSIRSVRRSAVQRGRQGGGVEDAVELARSGRLLTHSPEANHSTGAIPYPGAIFPPALGLDSSS